MLTSVVRLTSFNLTINHISIYKFFYICSIKITSSPIFHIHLKLYVLVCIYFSAYFTKHFCLISHNSWAMLVDMHFFFHLLSFYPLNVMLIFNSIVTNICILFFLLLCLHYHTSHLQFHCFSLFKNYHHLLRRKVADTF